MLMIISPAKTLDFTKENKAGYSSNTIFNNEINELVEVLNKYNIDNEIIDKYIKDIDEEILIGKIDKQINKMIKSNRKYSSNILKSKIYNNLYNNGFDKDMIINILNNYNF